MNINHGIDGHYAIPKHHPITCDNPAPWEIYQVQLEITFDRGIKVSIRGKNSVWFNAADCYIGDQNDMIEMAMILEHQRVLNSLHFQYDTNQS